MNNPLMWQETPKETDSNQTSAQNTVTSQSQGAPEIPTEEKEDDLNPFIVLLLLLGGFVGAIILILPIFMLSMGGGHHIDPLLLLFIGLGVGFIPLILYLYQASR